MSLIEPMLIKDEGLKLKPYKDNLGKLTIGIGRNLDDVGISKEEALSLMRNDLQKVEHDLSKYAWFNRLNESRKDVLRNMCFNIGVNKLIQFKKMIEALQSNDFEKASIEMLDSKWSIEVKERALRLSQIMRSGEYIA